VENPPVFPGDDDTSPAALAQWPRISTRTLRAVGSAARQWLGLDATLGRGGVDGAHIKITDHSWKDTQSLTPLLPVNRGLGKLRVEVVQIDEGS
jgi:hypothetical protein